MGAPVWLQKGARVTPCLLTGKDTKGKDRSWQLSPSPAFDVDGWPCYKGPVCFLGCSKVLFESTVGELLLRVSPPLSGHIAQLLHCPAGSAGWGALIPSGKQMHSLKHPQAAELVCLSFSPQSAPLILPAVAAQSTHSHRSC